MKKENQESRKEQIRIAAYDLLEKKGYKGASMLAIAKQARASNETLYSWYGTKQNLFGTLIEENAREVADAINESLRIDADLEKSLAEIGALLIKLVTSDRAVALNRAAAAEASETNTLGKILAKSGRESVFPMLEELFLSAQARKTVAFDNSEDVVNIYLGLLLGDTQIRRVTGAIELPAAKEIRKRSKRAASLLLCLLANRCL